MMNYLGKMTLLMFVVLLSPSIWAQEVLNNNEDHNTIVTAQQTMKANPDQIYWDRTPDVLFGIPIFKVTVGADGYIQNVIVLRTPMNPDAADTVDIAMKAMKKAQPFQNLMTNGQPVEFVQTFLFRNDRKFKMRVLDGYDE